MSEVSDHKLTIESSEDAVFESISFYFQESLLFDNNVQIEKFQTGPLFQRIHSRTDQELLSPRLWDLPDVFRKKLISYSSLYLNEVQKISRMSDHIRYNFSNGVQISSQEILRHRYQRKVPLDYLPNGKDPIQPFERWPFLQNEKKLFATQGSSELELIMQNLFSKVLTAHRNQKLKLYFQTQSESGNLIPIQNVEFDLTQELAYRVDLTANPDLQVDFKLVHREGLEMQIFESFVFIPEKQKIIVHPLKNEWQLIQDTLRGFSPDLFKTSASHMQVKINGELEAKALLNHLRTRNIPIWLETPTFNVEESHSLIQVQLTMDGFWQIQHRMKRPHLSDLEFNGWSTSTQYLIESLELGLAWILNMDSKDLISRSGLKREWDARFLKHLGILHYVFFETLHLLFEKQLSDGGAASQTELVSKLKEKIRLLLIASQAEVTVKDVKFEELCSTQLLVGLQKFSDRIIDLINSEEVFLRKEGEVRAQGLVKRELRLILELFKIHITRLGAEDFKRPKFIFINSILINKELGSFKVLKTAQSDLGLATSFFQNLIPYGFEIFLSGQKIQELGDDEFSFEMDLKTDQPGSQFNWFELNPTFFLKGEQVSLDTFLHSGKGGVIEYKGQYYLIPKKQLPSVKRLESFWDRLQKGQADKKKSSSSQFFQLPRHQTLELLALRASGIRIRGDEQWQRTTYFYDHLGKMDFEIEVPKHLKEWLKPYQLSGLKWLLALYELRMGALLADDMGLGKTLQTLSFLEILRAQDQLGRVMIVVPSSLIYNWQSEVNKFTPDLPLVLFSAKDKDKIGQRLESQTSTVLIVTYGLLMEHSDFLNQYKWNVTIFDEAQNLKNISTKRTGTARTLVSDFKVALTGTPMENHYGEFYSLLDILVPGSLGSLEDFRKQYVNPDILLKSDLDYLKLKVKPLMLRRTKKEILSQLPDKQETKVSIAFEERQKEIYRDIALSYNNSIKTSLEVETEGTLQLQMLTALLRLRQACSDPSALPNVKYDRIPPKLETLVESLLEITDSGESALVFTQFLKTLERTVHVLKEKGIQVFSLHGGLSSVQRQKILSDFQNSSQGSVLVMTLKTGGVGLNLTKASYVFHLEPWWNPSVENQATDRAHRLGQTKAVQVYRYIMHESLEEKIEILKENKGRKFQALFTDVETDLDQNNVKSGGLSKEDFDFLVGIKDSNSF